MLLTKKSNLTGKVTSQEINVSEDKIMQWESMQGMRNRPLIQELFPELNAQEREFIMNGISAAEWDKYMGEDEDDEKDPNARYHY